MVEERIVEVERPVGATHTHTTVYEDRPSSGGGAGWLLAIVAIVALIAAVYIFSNMSNSRAAKDDAIAGAARDVGAAADKVGNAAQDAADKVTQK
ncbi:hypothetical protein [Novosphingobium sp.]|uniref:hypothetical protein n=1 Tax=Novosphingobium sp. TaxID=1874826 RepID=UPI0038B9D6EE|nr:hypothetical protein [Pseudomonadota bacterium]